MGHAPFLIIRQSLKENGLKDCTLEEKTIRLKFCTYCSVVSIISNS